MSDKVHSIKGLLIEDDPDLARLTKEVLMKKGYEITWVATATEALEELAKKPYTFLSVDFALPDMTGLELFKRVKKNYPNVVVIMVTGSGTEKTAAEAMALGIDDYLIKGINQEYLGILPLLIVRALEQKRLQQKEQQLQEQLRQEAVLLEKKVLERTQKLEASNKELQERTDQLERFQKITVGRELQMIELKKEINTLLKQQGLPKKYKVES